MGGILNRRNLREPPPPPSSIRTIDSSAYTIAPNSSHGGASGGHGNGSAAGAGRLVIDDSRFKFRNAGDIPRPRKFEGKQKLYPSGRGSSVPLNLSLFS